MRGWIASLAGWWVDDWQDDWQDAGWMIGRIMGGWLAGWLVYDWQDDRYMTGWMVCGWLAGWWVDDSNWKACARALHSPGGPEKVIAHVGKCRPGTGAESRALHTSRTGLQGHNCASTAPRYISTAADSSTYPMDITYNASWSLFAALPTAASK